MDLIASMAGFAILGSPDPPPEDPSHQSWHHNRDGRHHPHTDSRSRACREPSRSPKRHRGRGRPRGLRRVAGCCVGRLQRSDSVVLPERVWLGRYGKVELKDDRVGARVAKGDLGEDGGTATAGTVPGYIEGVLVR